MVLNVLIALKILRYEKKSKAVRFFLYRGIKKILFRGYQSFLDFYIFSVNLQDNIIPNIAMQELC